MRVKLSFLCCISYNILLQSFATPITPNCRYLTYGNILPLNKIYKKLNCNFLSHNSDFFSAIAGLNLAILAFFLKIA